MIKKENCISVTLRDLAPFSRFEVIAAPIQRISQHRPGIAVSNMVKDLYSGRLYRYESPKVVRIKFAVLLATLPIQVIKTVFVTLLRICKVMSGFHFWTQNIADASPKGRIIEFIKDSTKIWMVPILLIGLIASNFIGLALPYTGRKLYSSYERLLFSEEKKRFFYNLIPFTGLTIEGPVTPFKVFAFFVLNPPYHSGACFQPLSLTDAEKQAIANA